MNMAVAWKIRQIVSAYIWNEFTGLGKRYRTACIIFAVSVLAACGTIQKPLPKPTGEIAKLKAAPPPTAGSLPNPVIGAKLQDTWQAARSGGRRHEGIDIFAKVGTPVYSTTDGIVTKIGNNKLGGKVIGIQGAGAWHYYAHLDGFAKLKLYQRVNAGQKIGYVGKTGNAKNTPPHLHYGIYLNNGAVNPYPLIKPN